MAIWASNFWNLAIETSVADGVEWEELGAVLEPGIDSTGVVLVVSDVS